MSETKPTAAQIAIAGVRSARQEPEKRTPVVREAEDLDHGPDGQAAAARPSAIVTIEGKARGSTSSERITVRRYSDNHPWDHYDRGGLLTERQLKAGWNLTRLYSQGYTPMLALPSYGCRAGASMSEEEDVLRSMARKEYDKLASLIPHSCRHAMACMVRGEFPRMTDRLRYLREACDVLADAMQIERVTTG